MKQTTLGCMLAAMMGLGFISGAMAENEPSAMDQAKTKVEQVVEQAGEMGKQVQAKAGEMVTQAQQTMGEAGEQLQAKAGELKERAQATANNIAISVENSEQAKNLTTGLLRWIYVIAEFLSFSTFYWLAFALMIAGVVSWTGQLILAKLWLATGGDFDIKEIISDAVVLAISVIGLVLTTQAAAQNSTFTQSTVMVLSATAVGAILGFVLYLWGQEQEVKAAKK